MIGGKYVIAIYCTDGDHSEYEHDFHKAKHALITQILIEEDVEKGNDETQQ